ncbi:MAG: flagellar biosynthetic protein FliR [Phycisphaerae bacterium]|nr:flagellar biosynthetic protein FliR [Phycisphaerae bacterium]
MNDFLSILLPHLVPLLLVVARVAGLFLLAPVLGNRMAPARFRALLAVALGAALYPGALAVMTPTTDVDMFGLAAMTVREALIGWSMGLIAALPILALELAGYIMGHQMGLGLARVFNPEAGTDSEVIGQVLMYIGIGVFLAIGGLEALVLILMRTFETIPIGGLAPARAPLDIVLNVMAAGMELAVRVAAPVTGIIFLVMIALGFLGKTMPQINVMSIGFIVKILAGLAMLAGSLPATRDAVTDELQRVLTALDQWARAA